MRGVTDCKGGTGNLQDAGNALYLELEAGCICTSKSLLGYVHKISDLKKL